MQPGLIMTADEAALTPTRVRHALRFRALTVQQVRRVTPHLVRITLGGDALEGFTSPGFDDHVKLFFPDAITGVLALPEVGPEGPVWPEGARPVMRDYTPRGFDAAARTLEIDFALHLAGPATQWAEQASVGQQLGVGGPRGSFIIPTAFDWHFLAGDDTALPAIFRRLAELPAGARAEVLVEVDGPEDHIALPGGDNISLTWVHRSTAAPGSMPMLDALRGMQMPEGRFHAWVGCESAQAKALRTHLVTHWLANPKWVRASGYWRRGDAGAHDSIGE